MQNAYANISIFRKMAIQICATFLSFTRTLHLRLYISFAICQPNISSSNHCTFLLIHNDVHISAFHRVHYTVQLVAYNNMLKKGICYIRIFILGALHRCRQPYADV